MWNVFEKSDKQDWWNKIFLCLHICRPAEKYWIERLRSGAKCVMCTSEMKDAHLWAGERSNKRRNWLSILTNTLLSILTNTFLSILTNTSRPFFSSDTINTLFWRRVYWQRVTSIFHWWEVFRRRRTSRILLIFITRWRWKRSQLRNTICFPPVGCWR